MSLEGRVAVVTGGGQGIGLGIGHAVVDRGGRVALFDVNADALAAARSTFAADSDVATCVVDVTDRDAVARAVEQVEAELGPVYALFNNAGVIDSVSPSKMRGETWDFVVNVNLHGVYNGLQAVVPGMIARGEGGYIVNTSSLAGMVPAGSGFAYHATKYAVVGLSESLRIELEHHNISVSVVCPSQVATDIVRNTRDLRPAAAETHTERVNGILDAAHERLHEIGADPFDVGRNIVTGMLAGQPYLFTDGSWVGLLEERFDAILDALRTAYPNADATFSLGVPQ